MPKAPPGAWLRLPLRPSGPRWPAPEAARTPVHRQGRQPVPGEAVYIERKRKRWEGNSRHHICRQGETAYSVGQSYAIRTRSIEKLNKLRKDEELAAYVKTLL